MSHHCAFTTSTISSDSVTTFRVGANQSEVDFFEGTDPILASAQGSWYVLINKLSVSTLRRFRSRRTFVEFNGH